MSTSLDSLGRRKNMPVKCTLDVSSIQSIKESPQKVPLFLGNILIPFGTTALYSCPAINISTHTLLGSRCRCGRLEISWTLASSDSSFSCVFSSFPSGRPSVVRHRDTQLSSCLKLWSIPPFSTFQGLRPQPNPHYGPCHVPRRAVPAALSHGLLPPPSPADLQLT